MLYNPRQERVTWTGTVNSDKINIKKRQSRIDKMLSKLGLLAAVIEVRSPVPKKILSAHRPGKSKRYMTEDIAAFEASSSVIWMSSFHLKPNISKPELLFSLQNLAPHVNSACQ